MTDYSSEWSSGSIDPDTMEVRQKVKVKFRKITQHIEEREIELPVYMKHMTGTYGADYLIKVNVDQSGIVIKLCDHKFESITTIKKYVFDDDDNFLSGTNTIKSSKQEFEQALKEAKKVVRGLKA